MSSFQSQVNLYHLSRVVAKDSSIKELTEAITGNGSTGSATEATLADVRDALRVEDVDGNVTATTATLANSIAIQTLNTAERLQTSETNQQGDVVYTSAAQHLENLNGKLKYHEHSAGELLEQLHVATTNHTPDASLTVGQSVFKATTSQESVADLLDDAKTLLADVKAELTTGTLTVSDPALTEIGSGLTVSDHLSAVRTAVTGSLAVSDPALTETLSGNTLSTANLLIDPTGQYTTADSARRTAEALGGDLASGSKAIDYLENLQHNDGATTWTASHLLYNAATALYETASGNAHTVADLLFSQNFSVATWARLVRDNLQTTVNGVTYSAATLLYNIWTSSQQIVANTGSIYTTLTNGIDTTDSQLSYLGVSAASLLNDIKTNTANSGTTEKSLRQYRSEGKAFSCGGNGYNVSTGEFIVALSNPVGSGKTIYIFEVAAYSDWTGRVQICYSDAVASGATAVQTIPSNLKADSTTSSVGIFLSQGNGGAITSTGNVYGTDLWQIQATGNSSFVDYKETFVEIPPGYCYGIRVTSPTSTSDTSFNIKWVEE